MRKQWPPDWWHHLWSQVSDTSPVTKKCLTLVSAMIGVALLMAPTPSWADQPAAPETKIERHSVTGQLVHVGYRSMSVEFANTAEGSFERLVPFEPDVKLAHVKSVRELKRGDTIRVDYADVYQKDVKGEWKIIKTAATEIALIKSAPSQQLGSRETASE